MKKTLSQTIKVMVLGIIIAGGLSVVNAATWQAPTVAPTGGNPDAPLNITSDDQFKIGGLVIGDINLNLLTPIAAYTYIFYTKGNLGTSGDIRNGGFIQVAALAGNGDRPVCADAQGQLKICSVVPPPTCTDPNASNNGGPLPCTCKAGFTMQSGSCQPVVVVNNCAINSFTANKTITIGGSAPLAWTTSNCTSASISPSVGTVSLNSSTSVSPTSTTTYTLTANGPSNTATKTVTITVGATTGKVVYTRDAAGVVTCTVSSGTYSNCSNKTQFITPALVTTLNIKAVGAGAGGGGGYQCANSTIAGGGGGGGGGYISKAISSPSSTYSITVGAVGTGGKGGSSAICFSGTNTTSVNGTAGGTTSFGTISVNGGSGGKRGPDDANTNPGLVGSGGSGGTATGGTKGNNGSNATQSSSSLGPDYMLSTGGAGGNSALGAIGAGGKGGNASAFATSYLGANGAPGYIEVSW